MTSTQAPSLPVTLKRRLHNLSARYNKWMLLGLLALFAVPVVLVALLALLDPDSWREVVADADLDWQLVALMILVPLGLVAGWATFRHERLIVDASGIRYRSLFRGPLAFLRSFKPDWSYRWSEIRGARIVPGPVYPRKKFRRRRVELDVGPGNRPRIEPYAWYTLPDEAALGFRQALRLDRETYREAVERSPLYLLLAEHAGLDDGEASMAEADLEGPLHGYPGGGYDLMKHPGMVMLLVGLIALGGYAVVDALFLAPWRPLDAMPVTPFLAAGVVALTGAAALTRSAPPLERWAVAGFFALAAMAAMYPAMLRLNAATDDDGATRYRYHHVETGRFEPLVDAELPPLAFDKYPEFWESLPLGSERDFLIVHGGFGFRQLDLAEVRTAQRRWFSRQ